MYGKIHHPLKTVALAVLLFFMVTSCNQSNGGSTDKTSVTAKTSSSKLTADNQNGITSSTDTVPSMVATEPPPPPPPSATPYPMVISDTLAAKSIAMSLKSWHIGGVKASVVNSVVTLTGNANKKDRRIILDIANQHQPKKVIDKITFK